MFRAAHCAVVIALVLLAPAGIATADTGSGPAVASCRATAGPAATRLVELYTSEGCSSCPPADRWLAQLVRAKAPAVPLVALAFHVDYWDYLGWRDPFARPEFTARQRQRVAAGGGEVIYTPQVLLDGRDYRGWGSAGSLGRTAGAGPGATAPRLGIALAQPADGGWVAVIDGQFVSRVRNVEVWVAIYEDGLASRVTRGENRGRALHHDRVVRQLLGPWSPGADGRLRVTVPVARPGNPGTGAAGVASFAEYPDGSVLQAVALPFCAE